MHCIGEGRLCPNSRDYRWMTRGRARFFDGPCPRITDELDPRWAGADNYASFELANVIPFPLPALWATYATSTFADDRLGWASPRSLGLWYG
jgi:hypothetical protein